jgi:outer membrane protein OmpA-like peptidoglycan-associated protein
MFSQAARGVPLPVELAAPRAPIRRIAQQRVGGEPTFLLVAHEIPPTRKTLAPVVASEAVVPQAVVPLASNGRANDPSPAAGIAPTRVRKPVGSVYFAFAASRLSDAASRTVAAAAAAAARADRLVLTAYTDPYGALELNRRLAELRAGSVAAALEVRGVDPAQVIVLSRPQCCARHSLPERDAAPYRRVDIEILTQRIVLSEERGDDPQQHS